MMLKNTTMSAYGWADTITRYVEHLTYPPGFLPDFLLAQVAQNIVISLENLEEITVVDGERWTMLTLRRPPSFDTEPNHPALEKDETIEKYRYRTRYVLA